MELKSIRLTIPENGNIILGQSHFIKSVEDIYEAIVNSSPHIQFGIAFNEASGDCLTRFDGNDEDLKQNAIGNATALGAGHVFVVALRNGFPNTSRSTAACSSTSLSIGNTRSIHSPLGVAAPRVASIRSSRGGSSMLSRPQSNVWINPAARL